MYTCVGVYCGVLVEVRGQLEEYFSPPSTLWVWGQAEVIRPSSKCPAHRTILLAREGS